MTVSDNSNLNTHYPPRSRFNNITIDALLQLLPASVLRAVEPRCNYSASPSSFPPVKMHYSLWCLTLVAAFLACATAGGLATSEKRMTASTATPCTERSTCLPASEPGRTEDMFSVLYHRCAHSMISTIQTSAQQQQHHSPGVLWSN